MFILTLLLSIQGFYGETATNRDIKSFKWLVGTWENVEYGTFESWKLSDRQNSLIGKAYRITALSDTVITEQMQIICEQETCYFIADVPQNPQPTRFKIVTWDVRSFRSENPEHDFPKFVAYRLREDGKTLEAKIGVDNRTMTFMFVKMD